MAQAARALSNNPAILAEIVRILTADDVFRQAQKPHWLPRC